MLPSIRVLRIGALTTIALLTLGAFRADSQAAIDDLDTGPDGAPAAIRALWSSAPVVDVDPSEPGSTSAGLQEALGRCNGGAGGCILQLRAGTTYALPVHTSWSSVLGGAEPRTAFHTNGADDVWLRGHGDSSVISYTQAGNGPDRLLRNWILTADGGSDRVLFSDFRIERTDQCTIDCREYAMVFTVLGDVSDVVIDNVTVHGTQLAHDGGYAGRNIFMVFAVAYPTIATAYSPRRVVVQNSRFSMSSSGIHTNHCNDCRFVGNHFDAEGVPDDDNGAKVRAFSIFKGQNYLIAKNAIDLAQDGRTTTNWTGCILVDGDQTFDPNQPQSARINEGASVLGNACTGLRQSSAAGIWFYGYKNADVTGNHIYGGVCSNDTLVSCQSREECGASPTLACNSAPVKAFDFEDMEWENANSNQGNVLRANRLERGTDCAVRIYSQSDADPNSNTGNTFVGNTYWLDTIQNQGFCGSGSDKQFQNEVTGNHLVNATTPGQATDRIDGVWLLSDARCDDADQNPLPIESTAAVYLAGSFHRVAGSTTGFGTADDFVRIDYDGATPGSVSANASSGRLQQWEGSRVCFFIDDPAVENGGRDTLVDGANAPICRVVEKCSVAGSVVPGTREQTPSGTASAKCSGAGLYADLSSEQLASVLAAFPAGNACGAKLHASQPNPSLSIKLEQSSRARVEP